MQAINKRLPKPLKEQLKYILRTLYRYTHQLNYPSYLDRVNASLTPQEKEALYQMACLVPADARVVEVGSFQGGSTCALAEGLNKNRAKFHAVDIFSDEPLYQQFLANTRPYGDLIKVHKGYSTDMIHEIEGPIDLLFIDGDHTWEGVTTDLKLYVPLLKEDGILMMHDIGDPHYGASYPGCIKAFQELVLPIEKERLRLLPNMYAGRIHVDQFSFEGE